MNTKRILALPTGITPAEDDAFLCVQGLSGTPVTRRLNFALLLTLFSTLFKGSWSGVTTYAAGQIVERNGSAYQALVESVNQAPPNVTYWRLIVEKGDTGAAGSTWHYGSTVPASELGADLDYYLRTTNGDVYRKVSGTWGIIANIQGPIGETGEDGADGAAGASAFTYIAYADDATGTGFTNTFDAAKDYVAILATDTELTPPVVGDFAGLWKNYKGESAGPLTPVEVDADGIIDASLSSSFYRTITADTEFTIINMENGAQLQLEITQPDPAFDLTFTGFDWVDDTSAPIIAAEKNIVVTVSRINAKYHATAALALDGEAAVLPTATEAAGEQIAARDLVWQDVTNALGSGRQKWWKVDTDASPPRIGPRVGMALAADDGAAAEDLTGARAVYHLDADTDDATGNGNDLIDSASSTFGAAKLGSGSGTVNSGGAGIFQLNSTGTDLQAATAFTVAGWFKFPTGATGWLFNHSNGGGQVAYKLSLPGGDVIRAHITDDAATLDSSALAADTWHFAVLIYDGANLKLSINGGAFATQAGTAPEISSGVFGIGAATSADVHVDEVVKWNRALTFAQVSRLYNSGTGLEYAYDTWVPGSFLCRLEPGEVDGFTGLTPGKLQYASATAGALTETVPTGLRRMVGVAVSTTEVYFDPRATEPQQNATPLGNRLKNELSQFIGPYNVGGSSEAVAFSSAGNTDITPATNSGRHFVTATVTTAGSPFTRTVSLLTAGRLTGDMAYISFVMPASTDPTIQVRNATAGGTLLGTINGEADGVDVIFIAEFDGVEWQARLAEYQE